MIIKVLLMIPAVFVSIGYSDLVSSFFFTSLKSTQNSFIRYRISFIRNWILHDHDSLPHLINKYNKV